MMDLSHIEHQIECVSSFESLLSTAFHGNVNALCWERKLNGNFSEIIEKVELDGNITELNEEGLKKLKLSEAGQLAREILVADLKILKAHGAAPVLNIIESYERDDFFFPTDVYSFHVDRSPVPTDTFLCTYHGASSDILPNSQGTQKVQIPELRAELNKLYNGPEEGFDAFLEEHFFDLHYQPKPNALPINLGIGNMWKIATDHPESNVLPCLHRAPIENPGEKRLLLIC